MATPKRTVTWDGILACTVVVVVVLYLGVLPRILGGSDEAYFLVEAKRIAGGEAMYRDVFEFIPPGAIYIMAAAFRVLGVDIVTSVIVMGILHALAAMLLFFTCRRLNVDRLFAAVVSLAYVGLCHAAWPHASWHWFSSLFLILQCWFLCGTARGDAVVRAGVTGLISGAMIGMQHQRGLPVAAAVGLLLILVHFSTPPHDTERMIPLRRKLGAYIGGMLVFLALLMLPSLWLAGADALIEGLIRFPIETYRPTFRTAWGAVGPLTKPYAPYTVPALLALAPIILVVVALRIGVASVSGRQPEIVRQWLTLLLLALSAIASIWYYADFIHIAFIAPIFLIAAAASLEWMLSPLRRWPAVATGVSVVIASIATAWLALHLQRNYTRAWATYKNRQDTAFGRIDFPNKWEPVLIDATRAALAEVPDAELFCYPTLAAPYLTTGGKNPTRYQFFDTRALPKRYSDEVVALLRQRRVEFLLIAYPYIKPTDPIAQLMQAEYEAVPIPALPKTGEFPTILLYRRKAELRNGAAALG